MATPASIERIYGEFGRHFPNPPCITQGNDPCCVDPRFEEIGRILIETPLRELSREPLEELMAYSGCIGTDEERLHFLPRALELLHEATFGDVVGLHCTTALIFRQRTALAARRTAEGEDLWRLIRIGLDEIFREKTSVFRIVHYDREACAAKGWTIDHEDLATTSEDRDDLLRYFYAELPEGEQAAFFAAWFADPDPQRSFHFIDACVSGVREWKDLMETGLSKYVADKSSLGRKLDGALRQDGSVSSPTWERDARACLGIA